MAVFNRRYELALQATSPDKQVVTEDKTGRVVQTETFQRFVITELHIEFDINFGERSGNDTNSVISIFNLPREILNTIENAGDGGLNISLTCFYDDGERHTVVTGNLSKVRDTFEGVDRKTTLYIRNTRKTIRDKKVKVSFRGKDYKKIDPQVIMDWFVEQLTNTEIGGNFDAMLKLAPDVYKITRPELYGDMRRYSVDGKLFSEFKKFLDRGDLQPYTANNVLVVVENGKSVVNAAVPIISAQQDLIGFPTVDNDGTDKENFGKLSGVKAFKIKTLLRSDIQLGFAVQVIFPRQEAVLRNDAVSGILGDTRSWTETDTFTVTTVKHKGSYEGSDWYSEFRIERIGG